MIIITKSTTKTSYSSLSLEEEATSIILSEVLVFSGLNLRSLNLVLTGAIGVLVFLIFGLPLGGIGSVLDIGGSDDGNSGGTKSG